MRLFTKRITYFTLTLILGLVLVACGGKTTTDVAPENLLIPQLTNPEAIYYQTDDFNITYRDLYNSLKINDGLNQLLAMVDTDLLKDYIDQVTQDQINKKREKLTFGTNDAEIIESFGEERRAEYIQNFEESLFLMGYETDIDDYIRLVLAREQYSTDLMLSEASVDETWHVGPKQIANYYDITYQKDIQSIKIKFLSENDAKTVMRTFNLVTRSGQLMLYTGTKPLAEVPSFELNETNTQTLNDEELLSYFIQMYNYVYQDIKDQLSETATVEELINNPDLTQVFKDIKAFNNNLANFMFLTLGNYEDFTSEEDEVPYYTYRPEKFFSGSDTAYYMILNLTGTEKADVKDFDGTKVELIELIGEDKYNEIETEIINNNLSSQTFVTRRIADLRREHDFVIYDYYLTIDYKSIDTRYVAHEEGSLTKVASYDDKTITPDQLLTYALNRNAAMYLIYSAQYKAVMAAHYENVYCLNTSSCEYDYRQNESAKMLEHVIEFNNMKTQFLESMYSTYYTFDEYLYLAYGVKSEEEMIKNYYVKSTLQPIYIFDNIIKNDYEILNDVLDIMDGYYENYFSLKANHILIYLDRDENGSPDNYEDFYEGLEDTTAYDAKLAALELAIREYLAIEDNTMAKLVSEYKLASRDNETWGEFKRYGFFLLTENLSATTSLTFTSTINKFERSFVDALVEIYQEYKLEENIDKNFIFNDTLVETSYGLHLIKAEKGTNFDMPSAKFTMTYNDDNEPNFTVGLENEEDHISFEQLKIYAQYRFTVIAFGTVNISELYGFTRPTIPTSVNNALKEFATSLHDALYVVGFMNIGIIEELKAGDFINSQSQYSNVSETDLINTMNRISEIYFRQIYAELDQR